MRNIENHFNRRAVGALLVFVIKFIHMDDIPFYKRPWFYIAAWLFALVALYGWQIYRIGGVQASILYVLLDLACLFPLFLFLWVSFFAQFVLPVQTISDRNRIIGRLFSYLSGSHGPALFIENGIIKEHAGERLKLGPGVVWLDSASAAVVRTPVRITQTLGPGVHFLEFGEYIAATLDLHIQSQTLGPLESDKPFDSESDHGYSEYQQVQDRRKQVSALTRDGIELVPNITVTFRVATGFPKENQSGSRFGYRTGITKKDKLNEKQDKEAIQKAILGEGINPNVSSDSPRHRVAWNQLPAVLAVDVWREYVAKFTRDELFTPDQEAPLAPPPAPEPTEDEVDPLSQPIHVGASQNRLEDGLTAMLREINKLTDRSIKALDGKKQETRKPVMPEMKQPVSPAKNGAQKQTGLQVITEMIKARLTQPEVDILNDHGRRGAGTASSSEFAILQSRGLQVLNVSIKNIRFHPTIEENIIGSWSAAWLNNAKEESRQLERRRNILEAAGQEQAIRQYAEKLSLDLLRKKPQGVSETLKILVMRSRAIIIENEQLRQRMTSEQEVFEDIIKWMEVNGK
jgi:hypothetical protein